MTTEIQRATIQLQDKIFTEKYYIDLYLAVLAKHDMSTASIDQSEFDDHKLISMLNNFWMALPDSKEIRRAPFFDLCDICENIFE